MKPFSIILLLVLGLAASFLPGFQQRPGHGSHWPDGAKARIPDRRYAQ